MSSVNTHYQNQVADLLGQIRAHQGEPSNRADLIRSDTRSVGGIGQVNEPGKGNFATYMADAFNGVNDTQQASADLKNAYERGEDVPLTDVVLSMQKASIGFEATLQVRNKLIRAYEDIMNMPV
jgi:flagellar hook-basal body complex protein FliE